MSSRRSTGKGDTLVADPHRQTQAERRDAAERAILEAAKTIVAERGIDEMTLHEVGEAAGYSRALPGHYFGSKSSLLHALADHITATYAQRVRMAPMDDNTLERLCQVITFCIDDAIRDPVSVRAYQSIVGASLAREELRPIVDKMTRQSIDDIAALISDGRKAGEIRADARPRAEASLIVASLRGVLFQWLMAPDHVSLLRVRDCLVANIRSTLKA